LSQAAACGCYFISTDVGGAETASNNWKFGTKIQQEDSVAFSKAVQDIIEGKTIIDESNKSPTYNFIYSKLLSGKHL
jgi:glycosyltransferase involved in cell wall biosynthesis